MSGHKLAGGDCRHHWFTLAALLGGLGMVAMMALMMSGSDFWACMVAVSNNNSEGGNDVLRRNMGRLDRTLRFIAGVALVPIGLFALGGWQGSLIGILVAAFAVLPLVTSLTGFCPGYVPFGISTVGTERKPAKSRLTG